MKKFASRSLACALLAALSMACQAVQLPKTEVVVLGMIHGSHRTSEAYGLDTLETILRAAKPDVVLTEIPPDRLLIAAKQFAETGTITESRVRVFPEYTDVLFPLQKELGFEIVGCSAWNKEMADSRSAKLAELAKTQPEKKAESDAGQEFITGTHRREGFGDDPIKMHDGDRYDEIVELGMVPYDVFFNDVLGPGGWTNINDSHWRNCSLALAKLKGKGKRVAITFGAWHKGRLRAGLATRDECVEIDAGALVREALGASAKP